MNICMIGCWYKYDIYSHQFNNIIETLKNEKDMNIHLLTSNCNCFSSAQRYSIAKEELLSEEGEVIKIPYAPLEPNKKYGSLKANLVKYSKLNIFLEVIRGFAFFFKARNCQLIHFDQVLRSFGIVSFTTLLMLSKFTHKKIVVTVHEIDPFQAKHKWLTKLYNKADKVIALSQDMKDELISLGVADLKIAIIHYSTAMQDKIDLERTQFIYYGGHKLLKGKGFDTLLAALQILKAKSRKVKVKIYVGEGCIGLEEGKRQVTDLELDDVVEWSDFLYGRSLAEAYQSSLACLIPFTGGAGRYPATMAMANSTPVIATRKAELPEYLGDLGIYLGESPAEDLANAMLNLMDHPSLAEKLGRKLKSRANLLFNSKANGLQVGSLYKEIYASG